MRSHSSGANYIKKIDGCLRDSPKTECSCKKDFRLNYAIVIYSAHSSGPTFALPRRCYTAVGVIERCRSAIAAPKKDMCCRPTNVHYATSPASYSLRFTPEQEQRPLHRRHPWQRRAALSSILTGAFSIASRKAPQHLGLKPNKTVAG